MIKSDNRPIIDDNAEGLISNVENFEISKICKSFFISSFYKLIDNDIIIACNNEDEALDTYQQLIFFKPAAEIHYFPSLDISPYDRVSPSGATASERSKILSLISTSNKQKIIITWAGNLIKFLPLAEIFKRSSLLLKKGMKISSKELADFLTSNGFERNVNVIDSGDFSVRGEILDLALPGPSAYRINFSWDVIESIRELDIDSQISGRALDELMLTPASEITLNQEVIDNFKRNYLTSFGVNYLNIPIYEALIEGRKFPAYENLLPLFYNNQLCLLTDYCNKPMIICDNLSLQAIYEYENSYHDLYEARQLSNKLNPSSFYPALPPEKLITTSDHFKKILLGNDYATLAQTNIASKLKKYIINPISPSINQPTSDYLRDLIVNNSRKKIVIFCLTKSSLEKIKNISLYLGYKVAEITDINQAKTGRINVTITPLSRGFYDEEHLFISQQDIFGEKISLREKQSSKRRLKNILTELDNLEEGELVVHRDYGIGKFIGTQIIEASGTPHDCLKILYAGNDLLYVPVENIGLIKKYGNFETELDKLGSANWQKRAARLKTRITEIAGQLIQIAASRKIISSNPVHIDNDLYEKFCAKFNYVETEDQIRAIDEIRSDLQNHALMDRLICGDVGFGKTEVAMRAAFMVAADASSALPAQVAVIVPTTILCKQHFTRFKERFNDFGFNVVQLSRLLTAKEMKITKENIRNGSAHIVIGTHALLAKEVKFNNLKLVIIDEEQHFGVSQKEKLKELKTNLHVLSLSATPIPRTLQMSMIGIKELSLIATPPIDRLPVKINVMPFDSVIIRDALLREHLRGGVSFYVCPRIKDMEDVEKTLKQIVPELRYKVAHGQMPASQIDEIMNEFCEGKFDILLSTTIIESGIDISTANTMIIHKADQLGLSQLYQLKGRIGRGKIRGYAYLTLQATKKLTKHALKRLEIMQTIDALGAGFSIASHDMDLRGFGNLVGEEQSGQIREVGLELYQEMLASEIEKQNSNNIDKTEMVSPSIKLSLPVLIPDSYVDDSSLKLALYRRIGELQNKAEIEEFYDEMIDRFGPIPQEFKNLLDIVAIKQECIKLSIESLDSGPGGFVVKFSPNSAANYMVMQIVNQYPRFTKIKPDNKLIFMQTLNQDNVVKETTEFIRKLGLFYSEYMNKI